MNLQLVPTNSVKIAIDNFTGKTFNATFAANETRNGAVLESRREKIVSPFEVINLSDNNIRLAEFDRAIFDAAISELTAGNEYTSPRRIYRLLGGSHSITKKLSDAILESFERLATVRAAIEMKDANAKFGYGEGRKSSVIRGYLLPTESIDVSINGERVTAIHFLRKGVLLATAEAKEQIITCPVEFLQTPIRHSERGIALTHYLTRRILEMKGSYAAYKAQKTPYRLPPTISFADLLERCNIANPTRAQAWNVRNIVETILNYFIELGEISGYIFTTGAYGKILSIQLQFSPPKLLPNSD